MQIFLLFVFVIGKHANKKVFHSCGVGGEEEFVLVDKLQSLSLQEFTVINCELLSLIFFTLIKTPDSFST